MKKGHRYTEYERVTHHLPIHSKRMSSDTVRKIKEKKFGGKCIVCGNSKMHNLALHHIVPRCNGGPDDITNLVCVCHNCHSDIHHSMAVA